MHPSHTVETSISCTYMLSSRPTRSVGTRTANSISTPPIVGVPRLESCPSSPRSRISSPIWWRRSIRMIERPNMMVINSARITASAERKDMYWNIPEPGMSYASSRYRNSEYNILDQLFFCFLLFFNKHHYAIPTDVQSSSRNHFAASTRRSASAACSRSSKWWRSRPTIW